MVLGSLFLFDLFFLLFHDLVCQTGQEDDAENQGAYADFVGYIYARKHDGYDKDKH